MDVELQQPTQPACAPDCSKPDRRAGGVRLMSRGDIPAVARLFSKVFRHREGKVAPDLVAYLETVFFGSPHYRPEHGSIVHDLGNGVSSAILALPMEFSVHGRPVIAKLLCAFMADGKDSAVGAAQLARQMRAARQDMCFSDNSSPVSADHWVAGGGIVLPVQSLEWHRVFRPLSAAAIAAGRRVPLLRSSCAVGAVRWLDRAFRRQRGSIVPAGMAGCRTVLASPEEFLHCAGPMMERFPIRPAWGVQEFNWLYQIAAMNRNLGELSCRIVVEESGRSIGAFLFFGKKGGMATVLNIVCLADREFDVVGQMFASLDDEGYASASGISQPFLMNAISRQRWLSFKHRGYFCMVTRHAEIKDAALRNDIYVGGLASESWSRLLTDF